MRSASRPAGIANRMKGNVSAVCSSPVWPSPTPSSSTATMGAAASAICSADCAARLDQASRLKVLGREGDSLIEDMLIEGMASFPKMADLVASLGDDRGQTHPLTDEWNRKSGEELVGHWDVFQMQ